jgi:membrane protease subunit HflC
MNRNAPTLLIAGLVIVVILLMMCAFQVRFTETAVVTRFDQIKEVIGPDQAGLHFKLPWPIDQVHRYDNRLQSFETEFRQVGTEDQKTVVLTAFATWRICDAQQFLKSVSKEDTARDKLRDLLENRVSIVLRTHPLSNLVNIDKSQMKLAQIEDEFLSGIRETAKANYGIELVSVGIKRLGIPESVTKEVFERMKQDRQKTIKELTAEGEAKATEIKVSAEEVAGKILARADAYAKTLEGQGEAEAAKYYAEFAKNPALSNLLKERETLLRILAAGQTTLILDSKRIAPFTLLQRATTSAKESNSAPGSTGTDDEKPSSK